MAKTAQQKFNERLEQRREFAAIINEFEQAAVEAYDGSYSYACGWFNGMLLSMIMDLPKTQRDMVRDALQNQTQNLKNQHLVDVIAKA